MRSGTALLLTRAFFVSTFRFPLTALLLRFTLSSCTAFSSKPITGSAAEGCLRPVEAVQTWLAAAEICTGPAFRPVLKAARAGGAAIGLQRSKDRHVRHVALTIRPAAVRLWVAALARCPPGRPSPPKCMSWRAFSGEAQDREVQLRAMLGQAADVRARIGWQSATLCADPRFASASNLFLKTQDWMRPGRLSIRPPPYPGFLRSDVPGVPLGLQLDSCAAKVVGDPRPFLPPLQELSAGDRVNGSV